MILQYVICPGYLQHSGAPPNLMLTVLRIHARMIAVTRNPAWLVRLWWISLWNGFNLCKAILMMVIQCFLDPEVPNHVWLMPFGTHAANVVAKCHWEYSWSWLLHSGLSAKQCKMVCFGHYKLDSTRNVSGLSKEPGLKTVYENHAPLSCTIIFYVELVETRVSGTLSGHSNCLHAGHHVCKAAWLHLMGIGKHRIARCKNVFKGTDLRTLTGHGGTFDVCCI